MFEILANITLVIHITFVLFVIFGSLLFFVTPKVIYLHLPSLVWGSYVEFSGSICPLTYLENWFLYQGNLTTYSNSFIQNYILPIIYPKNLSSELQIYLGTALIIINIIFYLLIILNLKKLSQKTHK